MTAFRIHCPTCSSRLKVKSQKLIGQIVNCPKCGSMVEVTAPTEEEPRPIASAAVVAPVPPAPASAPEGEANAGSSDAIFEGVEEMLDPASSATTSSEEGTEPADSAGEQLAAGRFSDGEVVSKWRGMALIGGTSVMALVTFGAIGYALFGGREPVEVAQFEPPASEEQAEENPAKQPEPRDTEPEEEKTPEIEQPADEAPTEPPSGEASIGDPSTVEEPGSEAVVDTPGKAMLSDPAEREGEATAVEEKTREDDSARAMEDNPFLFGESPATPSADGANATTPGSANPATSSNSDKQRSILELKDDPLYEVFGESFPVFDPETFEQSALSKVDTPVQDAPVAMPEVRRTPEPVPPTPVVDVAARLRDPIVRVEFNSIPLNQFASFITQMSTVPVTLDPVALAYADISATTPIVVQQSQTSVQGILETAIRPFGLEVKATEASARLQIQSPLDGKLRVARLQCDDLAENEQQVADLAYLLTHLVEPRSWKQAGGPGVYRNDPDAIMVSQTEVAHYQAVMFFDKLRVARGLSPLSQYSKARFDLTHRSQQVAPALAKEAQVQIVVPTPLFKVIDQLEKSSGLTILCDWDSLATNKLVPATPVTLSAQNIPVEDALRQLGQAWKMVFVPIDAKTVQLVAEQSVPVRPWLEFYDLGGRELGRAEATALINDAKRELSDLRKTGLGDVLYDPASKHLLALLSKDDHQRLRFVLSRRTAR